MILDCTLIKKNNVCNKFKQVALDTYGLVSYPSLMIVLLCHKGSLLFWDILII